VRSNFLIREGHLDIYRIVIPWTDIVYKEQAVPSKFITLCDIHTTGKERNQGPYYCYVTE